jgi:uncharacterized membrane protein
MTEKNLELERLVFFSDAVVAIAITLLALDLKIEHLDSTHLTFRDVGQMWPKLIAFVISFLNIGIFWLIHHRFFAYIRKVDITLLRYNMFWLFFIVMIPFTTSLVSSYFYDTAAIFFYCLNILFVAIFQNQIWDYVSVRSAFLKETISKSINFENRLSCNVAMLNAVIAITLSFFSPPLAFTMLFLRLPMIYIGKKIFKPKD